MRLPAVPSDNRFRILIAEDDPAISRLVAVHLKMAGFDSIEAPDGVQAWSQFPTFNPHLLLTDIHMPGMSGHELVEKVRSGSAIPILMMTAVDTDEAQMRGFKVGADDYIPKPFNPKLLVARVIANLRRVYRYDGPAGPSATVPEVNRVPAALADGSLHCDSCGYIGPVWKFNGRDTTTGEKAVMCPNCGNKHITFEVG